MAESVAPGLERIWASQREATRIVVGWPPPKSAQERAAEWVRVLAQSKPA